MKKKWIWLLLPAALLLLVLLHVHSLARLAPSEMGRQVPVLMYHAVGDDCWGEEHLFVRPAELEQQLQQEASRRDYRQRAPGGNAPAGTLTNC